MTEKKRAYRDENHCSFHGRLGSDLEIVHENVGTVSLANSADYKKDGKVVEKTNWIPLVFNGKAEYISKIAELLTKGSFITVTGSLETTEYTDKNDKKCTGFQVRVKTFKVFTLDNSKPDQDNPASAEIDDEIPF